MAAQDRPDRYSPDRYSGVAIWLHWTIALLIIVNLAVGLLHDAVPVLRSWMGAHQALGLAILALTAARIAWRLAHRPPPLPAATPVWERVLAHSSHTLLYVLMIGLPMTGWIMVSGGDRPGGVSIFGLFDVPHLPVSKATGHVGHDAHGILGWAMLALVVLHIGAALRHHMLLRDTVLTRMIPVSRQR